MLPEYLLYICKPGAFMYVQKTMNHFEYVFEYLVSIFSVKGWDYAHEWGQGCRNNGDAI